jgi:hypothetical protein
MPLQLELLQKLLTDESIIIHSTSEHTKASENYVELTFRQDDEFEWTGLIPYFYRRTGLFIETEQELTEYLITIKPFFNKSTIEKWIKDEKHLWNTEFTTKTVTKPFFDALSSLTWTSDFPQNDNPQRRIQDIKELGYTIATRRIGRKTERLLVPIPRGLQTGYEVFSQGFRTKAINVLNSLNVYELSSANRGGLLPDHKFPEIRWDAETRAENPENMTNEEVKNKFQLLDNQRNQQKREVCRQCFQTGKRGVIFGIKFFYAGNENWAANIPKVGKSAEQGCVGCGWYDIEKWRNKLNRLIEE